MIVAFLVIGALRPRMRRRLVLLLSWILLPIVVPVVISFFTLPMFTARYGMIAIPPMAILAAAGIGGGTAWVQPDRSEREALTLEAVKLAAELGVDINAADIDGRTALDSAKALKYDTVVKFLVDNGAVSGASKKGQTASAGKD